MSLPVIASQISLAVGLWMVLSVLYQRKRDALQLEVAETHAREKFRDYARNKLEAMRPILSRYGLILRKLYLQLAQYFLHLIRIAALKLESASAKWLHQVRTSRNKPIQPVILSELPKQNGQANGQQENGNGNGNFFSALKESSSHEVVESKLEELKNNKPGSETSAGVKNDNH